MRTRSAGSASRSQVAQKLGVSEAAVYAALTDRKTTIGLTEDTRERIRRVAREMGYEPSVLARSLSARKSFLLSLLVRSPIQPIIVPILEGAQNCLHDRGYSLITYYHGTYAADEAEHLNRSIRRKVDGIITYPALDEDGTTNAELYRQIQGNGTPVVQIGHAVTQDVPVVMRDLVRAGAMAVEQLWQMGHRRIAILIHELYNKEPAPGFWGDVVPILAGYERAMKARQQAPIIITRPMLEGSKTGKLGCVLISQSVDAAAAKILAHPARPTAILTMSEAEGAAMTIALHRLGVAVPEQMSVISRFVHSISEDSYEQTSQTGVGFEMEKLGEVAASVLFDAIDEKLTDARRRSMISPVYVPGRTCGPCPMP